ncbi:hypothetical protein [uncultured Novosphingobium sp.]|uniref:hypothetical protein n=1 Tax=uncultured Novosphingobium sp. TaxID=292277 RepID=UPI002585674A|nr:hypothetical protein [uncultured Novosphingobium sp.]
MTDKKITLELGLMLGLIVGKLVSEIFKDNEDKTVSGAEAMERIRKARESAMPEWSIRAADFANGYDLINRAIIDDLRISSETCELVTDREAELETSLDKMTAKCDAALSKLRKLQDQLELSGIVYDAAAGNGSGAYVSKEAKELCARISTAEKVIVDHQHKWNDENQVQGNKVRFLCNALRDVLSGKPLYGY